MGLSICLRKFVYDYESDKCSYIKLANCKGILYENDYPEWANKFVCYINESVIDYDSFIKKFGFDLEESEIGKMYKDKNNLWHFIIHNKDKEYDIYQSEIPKKEIAIPIIYYKEIAQQSKGVNAKFYDDYKLMKINDDIYTLKELKSFYEKYVLDDYKEYFKENILDKFEENRCIVSLL